VFHWGRPGEAIGEAHGEVPSEASQRGARGDQGPVAGTSGRPGPRSGRRAGVRPPADARSCNFRPHGVHSPSRVYAARSPGA